MRVLFLHPETGHGPPAYGVLPVGAFSICAGLAAAGHDVKMLNLALERHLNPWFDLTGYLQSRQPDLILLELHWYVHAVGALAAAKVCKQWNQTIPVIAGGLTASFFMGDLLQPTSAIDGIVSGDAEIPVLELVNALAADTFLPQEIPNLTWKQTDGSLLTSTKHWHAHDLNTFSFHRYDLLEHWSTYIRVAKVPMIHDVPGLYTHFWLANARGCVYTCDFCGGGRTAQQAIYSRRSIVQRDWTLVTQDIQWLWEQLDLQQVALSYDLALQRPGYYEPLLAHWRQAGWETGLYNECWQLPSPHFLDIFCQQVWRSHSLLVFSPISGSEPVRRANGKYYSNQALLDAVAYLARYQIPIQLFFNLNAQGQDQAAFDDTLVLCQQIVNLYHPALLALYCQSVQPEPLSPRAARMASLAWDDYLHQAWKQNKTEQELENQARWDSFLRDYTHYQQQINSHQAWPFYQPVV